MSRHTAGPSNRPAPTAGARPNRRGDAVNTTRLVRLTLALCAVLVLPAGHGQSELSEPDHIVYGTPTWYGAPLAEGTVELVLEGGESPVARYELGSDPTLGGLFVLRVPMDSVDPRRSGSARLGDPADLLVNGTLAGRVVVGERGTAQLKDADPEDAETTPALSIGDVSLAEGDAGTLQAVLTVSLSVASEDPVTVDWVTEDGSAVGGLDCGAADYVSASGMATVAPGDLSTTLGVTLCGELLEEPDETFFVNLLNPTNAALLDPQGQGTIIDDDTPPGLSVNNVTITEPPSGSVLASFRVSLTREWDLPVDFGYATANGTANAGSDYLATSGTGHVDPGSLETIVTVEVLSDTLNEDDETFFLNLQNPVNASILDGQGQCIVVDGAQFLIFVEVEKDGIAGADGLAGAFASAVSPDGAHVYVAGRSEDALALFARDPVSGSLAFVRAYTPADFQNRFTESFIGLDGPEAIAVSADGAHLYVAAYNHDAVSVFARDPLTGLLTLLEVERDGVNDLTDPGGTVDGLDGATDLALSGDDAGLYVAGTNDGAVAVFGRDPDPSSPTYGRLTFREAEKDGVDDPSDLGGVVDGLHLASAVAVSPDGATVYATGRGDNALAAFARDLDPGSGTLGKLSFLQVQRDGVASVDGLAGAAAVAVSPDGAHVYAAGSTDNALAAFTRATDGTLTWLEVARNGSGGVQGLGGAAAVVTSRDGGHLYAAGSLDSSLVVLERGNDPATPATFGRLGYVEVKKDGVGGIDGLFGANSVSVSADDLSVYVTGDLDSAVTAFARDLIPPTDPLLTSPTHVPGVWSRLPVVAVTWSGAADNLGGAGVAGYSFLFDLVGATTPDTALDLPHTVDPHGTASAPLPSGIHWFHLRTCDHAGNCSSGVHLGELLIDLEPPLIPGGVLSLSHVVGIPSADPTIDMTWTTPVDVGAPPSGLAGYSYVFASSPTPVCNQEVDLGPAEVAVSSAELSAGAWYFHICAGDVAGNWGPTATAGPFEVIDDAVPPKVILTSSVSLPDGGSLPDEVVVDHSITQLLVTFSKAMENPPGDTVPIDVTNPVNYVLVAAGEDGIVDTLACGALSDNDVAITTAAVVYDDVDRIASARFLLPGALPLGRYGLLLCADGLEDINGNPLDGDGNGTGGDDFLLHFTMLRSNALDNPNLDGSVSDWSLSSATDITYADADADDAVTSGSALVNRTAGADTSHSVSQCVQLPGLDAPPFFLSGLVRVEETLGGDPGATTALGSVVFRSDPSCEGAQVGAEVQTNAAVDDTGGAWILLEAEVPSLTGPAASALVSFTVSLPPGEDFPYLAWFDNLQFQTTDATPPLDPVVESTSHTVGVWSNLPDITMVWGPSVDPNGIGVAGYSHLFDAIPDTLPDDVVDTPQAAGTLTTASGFVADGAYYFHLRTCDLAGNCTATVHAGPYQIDTVAPANPTGAASTSHTVGAPSAVSVIDIAWTPAVDLPPFPSGAVGYSLSFDQSAAGTPDLVVDLPVDATGVSSEPFGNGTFYFHLRTLDLAGNWSAVLTLGPYVINDTVPPTVLDVGSVAALPDGFLDPDDATEVAVTQLLVALSEPVRDPAGSTGSDDVTNPDNYRVVAAGPDGLLQTTTCLSLAGDDLLLPIAEVRYELPLRASGVRVASTSLPTGSYRFIVCGSTSITDPAGNHLDGDGNGTGGDDFLRDFRVLATNLLVNPNFDRDLAGWSAATVPPSQFEWSADDGDGTAFSGSALIANLSGPDVGFNLSQCVALATAGAYELGALVRLDQGGLGVPAAHASVEFHGQAGCTGAVLATATTTEVGGNTGGAFEPLGLGPLTRPAGAVSARVRVAAEIGSDPSADFTAIFDNLYFRRLVVLFADGFESGTTGNWSSATP